MTLIDLYKSRRKKNDQNGHKRFGASVWEFEVYKSEFHSRLRQVNDEVLWPSMHFFLTFEISGCSCRDEVVVTHESKTGRWQANICM
ncbi:hypothetical protein DFO73_10413 [Cytobacillus oceanisediminis]|uniref:Uncharacterized protein n=1 Tax=Cytobacillus oceanisediminis TaxID=665099 RepID=A0A2V2ZY72_9BACI|nr:hypothetical protein [Cytobacillus oceanisediminis]PWW29384.1 hypothetical protein DFO73_10413 [Cytobacillus oceanisediminis]